MLAQKKPMDAGILAQHFRDALRQFHDILRIFQNRHPLAMLVRAHALQPLQHFVTFERNTALRRAHARQYLSLIHI